ncbi:hypothetical protein PhCBS80983_g04872 [Powellomyces hirtus]|uniref:Zn(2)-C6 fungal-type domain-containing protein n=1 Tax=Powellomyces hirtus TaxID=109895 RepID=A0A507DWC0_9FUNG|nr:hypothetical protein PhCBS80983_g04872 [Powellomyces hirtus]
MPYHYEDHDDSTTLTGKPRKRLTQSCDRCKAKKRRCDGAHPCSNCTKAKATCTMLIEQKKRGPKRSSIVDVPEPARYSSEEPASSIFNDDGPLSPYQEDGDDASDHQASENGSDSPAGTNSRESRNGFDLLYEPTDQDAQFSLLSSAEPSDTNFFGDLEGFGDMSVDGNNLMMDTNDDGAAVLKRSNDLGRKMPSFGSSAMEGVLSDPGTTRAIPAAADYTSQASSHSTQPPASSASWIPQMPSYKNLTPTTTPPTQSLTAFLRNDSPIDFHLHMINLFFTYFHPTYPILHERTFFDSLTSNGQDQSQPKVSTALLHAVYSIGVLYSSHPDVVSLGGRSKASSDFARKAEAFLKKGGDVVARCLIDIRDFGSTVSGDGEMELFPGTWRMAQKTQLGFDSPCDTVYSVINGRVQEGAHASSSSHMRTHPTEFRSTAEKKRAWWGLFTMDTFVTLSTGYDLSIDESLYMESLLDTEALVHSAPHSLATEKNNLESRYGALRQSHLAYSAHQAQQMDWNALLGGFPTNTVFGLSADRSGAGNGQNSSSRAAAMDHLFTPLSEVHPHIRIEIFMRKVMRSMTLSTPPSAYVGALHSKIMQFPKSFPPEAQRYLSFTQQMFPLPMAGGISTGVVHTLLLFFATLSLIHQSSITDVTTTHDVNGRPMTSLDVCVALYQRMNLLIEDIYAARFAQTTDPLAAFGSPAPPPPHELVSTPFSAILLTVPVIPLLSSHHASALIIPASGAVPCLEQTVLPTLDDMGMVWARASRYAAGLRGWAEIVRDRGMVLNNSASLPWKPTDDLRGRIINMAFDL